MCPLSACGSAASALCPGPQNKHPYTPSRRPASKAWRSAEDPPRPWDRRPVGHAGLAGQGTRQSGPEPLGAVRGPARLRLFLFGIHSQSNRCTERPGSRWGGFGPAERSGLRHPPPSPRPHPTPAALLVHESKMPGKFRLHPKTDPELRLGRGNTVAPLSTAAGLARVTQRTKQSRTAEGEQGSSHVRTRRDSRGCHSHQLVRGRQVEEPVMQRKHAVPSGFGMRLPLRLTGKGQTDWHRPQDKGPRAGRPAFT